MAAEPVFFRDLAYVLIAAVLGGALAWLARQPLVVGYVVGGMVISPLTPGPSIADSRHFEVFAEIGVVMLMFSIGIEFSLKDLMRVRWVALVGGPLGTALLIGLTMATGAVLGWPLQQGLVVGVVISVASTMVLARVLLDRGELHTRHGRVLVGISLVEDLAVVVFLALMPALGVLAPDRLLLIGRGLGVAALILVPFFLLAARTCRPSSRGSPAPATTSCSCWWRSPSGWARPRSPSRSAVAGARRVPGRPARSHLGLRPRDAGPDAPLRDMFGAFFFVTVGALIDPRRLFDNLPLLGTMVLLVVVGKLLIRVGVVWLFGETPWTALLTGIGLAQIGEFSFVLVQAARRGAHRLRHLPGHPGRLADHDLASTPRWCSCVRATSARSAPPAGCATPPRDRARWRAT